MRARRFVSLNCKWTIPIFRFPILNSSPLAAISGLIRERGLSSRVLMKRKSPSKTFRNDDYFLMMTDVLGPLDFTRDLFFGWCSKPAYCRPLFKGRMQPLINMTLPTRDISILNVKPAIDADCVACRFNDLNQAQFPTMIAWLQWLCMLIRHNKTAWLFIEQVYISIRIYGLNCYEQST